MDRDLVQKLAQKHPIGDRITITVDYCCLDRNGESVDMATLRQWQDYGLVEIVATEAMEEEWDATNPNVKDKLRDQVLRLEKIFPEYPSEIGKAVIGRSAIGEGGTVRDDKDIYDYCHEFIELMFPNFASFGQGKKVSSFQDAMHVSIHYLFNRDIFLTLDSDFMRNRKKLSEKFDDLHILTPKECVSLLQEVFSCSVEGG